MSRRLIDSTLNSSRSTSLHLLISKHDFASFRLEWLRVDAATRQAVDNLGRTCVSHIIYLLDTALHRFLSTPYINTRSTVLSKGASSTSVPDPNVTDWIHAKSFVGGHVLKNLKALLAMTKLIHSDSNFWRKQLSDEALRYPLNLTLSSEPIYLIAVMKSLFESPPPKFSGIQKKNIACPVSARELVAHTLDGGHGVIGSHVRLVFDFLPLFSDFIELLGPKTALRHLDTSASTLERLMHVAFVMDCPRLFRNICLHTRAKRSFLYQWETLLYDLISDTSSCFDSSYLFPLLTRLTRSQLNENSLFKRPFDPKTENSFVAPGLLATTRIFFGKRTWALLAARQYRRLSRITATGYVAEHTAMIAQKARDD